ncbi:MAG: hypothetical protein WCW26_01265 [Candidatus Buchananbacteria bacterium]
MKMKLNLLDHHHNFWLLIGQMVFRFALITFLILFGLDFIFPGFVTNWFNPIWFLLLALFSVIIFQDK